MRRNRVVGPQVDKAAEDSRLLSLDREPARVLDAQRAVELAADDQPAVDVQIVQVRTTTSTSGRARNSGRRRVPRPRPSRAHTNPRSTRGSGLTNSPYPPSLYKTRTPPPLMSV